MDSNERIMRLHIAGSWTAKDMADSLLSFRDLYNLRLGLQIIAEESRDLDHFWFELGHVPPFRRRMKRRPFHPILLEALLSGSGLLPMDPTQLARLLYPSEELKVRRIEYASPGFKDLAGLGEIIGHVKDFTLKLIEHFSSKRSRNLRDDEHELRNQSLRIQNAREFVALAKDCGFEETDLRQLVHVVDNKQEPLITLIAAGKIQKVHVLDEPNNEGG